MQAVASTIFWIIQFPFQGHIVTVDQLDFIMPSAITNDANSVPLLNTPRYKDIGVVLIKYFSLMEVFPLSNPPPTSQNASINMISNTIIEKVKSIVDKSASFNPFEEVYNAIQSISDPTINDHLLMASNHYHMPYCLDNPPISILTFIYTSYR